MMTHTLQGPAQQWVNGFGAEHAEQDWADEFAARFTGGSDPNQWMEEFSSDMEAQQAAREAGQPHMLCDLVCLCSIACCAVLLHLAVQLCAV